MGWAADRWGRKPIALIAVIGMTLATSLQGILPAGGCTDAEHTDDNNRVGLALLVVLRLCQGLSVGGEESSISALLSEGASMSKKAFATSLYLTTAFFAFLTSSVVGVLNSTLGADSMMCWGWRIPFILVLPIGFMSFLARRDIKETRAVEVDEHQCTADNCSNSEAGKTSKLQGSFVWNCLVGFLAVFGMSAQFYISSSWCIEHAKSAGMPASSAQWLAVAQNLALMLMTPSFGMLGDVVGVGTVHLAGCILTMVLGVPVFWLFQVFSTNWAIGFVCLGIGYGIPNAMLASSSILFCSELFPMPARAFGIAMTHNLAMSIVGGTAPLVATALFPLSAISPGIFISSLGCVSAITVTVAFYLYAKGHMHLTHMRSCPYMVCLKVTASTADTVGDAQTHV